jgi:hypothetical protein
VLFLAVQDVVPQWTRTRGWTKALLAFKIQFGDPSDQQPPPTLVKMTSGSKICPAMGGGW